MTGLLAYKEVEVHLMADCSGCKKTTDHTYYDKKDRQFYCIDCKAENVYQERVDLHEFKPYDLKHGPKELVPNTDPNKKLYFTPEGKRVADMDTIHISNRSEEARYFELMNIRKLDKGEKVLGIKAELKDKPARKTFSFVGKPACSSCS